MGHSISYVVNNSEFADKIENLFHEYVALFMKLHYPADAVSDAERRELTLKLKESVNAISLLAMKRKRFKFDTKSVKHHLHQASGTAERSYRPVVN
jgi:predicted transcriptional regulator